MDFSEFLQIVPNLRNAALPAEQAHLKMAPPERVRYFENLDWSTLNPRKAAVLLLVYPRNDQATLVLIQRNSYKGVHSSQMAFPGGKVEEGDSTLIETALREAREEVGLDIQQVEIVRMLSSIYIPPSNFTVQPVLAYLQQPPIFVPDPREVAGIVEFGISHLLDDSKIYELMRETSYANEIRVPAYRVDDHIIWGATAMILSEFKEVIHSALSL